MVTLTAFYVLWFQAGGMELVDGKRVWSGHLFPGTFPVRVSRRVVSSEGGCWTFQGGLFYLTLPRRAPRTCSSSVPPALD